MIQVMYIFIFVLFIRLMYIVQIHPSKNNKDINIGPKPTRLHGHGSLPGCCWSNDFYSFHLTPSATTVLIPDHSRLDNPIWRMEGGGGKPESLVPSPNYILSLKSRNSVSIGWMQPGFPALLNLRPLFQDHAPLLIPPLSWSLASIYVNSYFLLYVIWLDLSAIWITQAFFSDSLIVWAWDRLVTS